jgi:hypothetical protein
MDFVGFATIAANLDTLAITPGLFHSPEAGVMFATRRNEWWRASAIRMKIESYLRVTN